MRKWILCSTTADLTLPSLNLHQLEILCAVAERQNITQAAYDLHLTQPAVSLQIKALEKECGLLLLERGGRKLRLTQAGEALHRCALAIFHAKDEAERVMAELREPKRGKLILGANITGGMYLLPRIVSSFRALYPEAEIIFLVESTVWLYERVLQNAVDICLVGGPSDDRRLSTESVCLDHVTLIVSPAHPFAGLRQVSLSELANHACILPLQGSRTRQFVERTLREKGVALRVVMQLPGTEAVKKAVEANLGFAFVSGYSVEHECAAGTLVSVPVEGTELVRPMELIYKRQKFFSPIAQRFREFVHAYTKEHLPAWKDVENGAAAATDHEGALRVRKGVRSRSPQPPEP